ncbi:MULTISPECIES: hypothetical protein [Streptomyces]|uniref:Bacterial transcriptional activator domain-containing protein n=1 Tax=Streptomyces glycanivorans TaxID=3033808 RepID=A0ABY9J3K1_9ACTN|nr:MULTISPECIES: hypothetical protein [unclassified Streptomyces]WSQ75911.1 hypothetical protein OG725_01935 [Streptomyces sp. NBC_01213]TXS12439.1 hypothetical protein EAO68_23070 [Streptomyces sp. wa22]WLQ62403.1 hypothetical protein P8A20_01830 [Streptomyces sp. Alt3]WSQ83158.1 hypothetical protein OG722_01875 [Streptomyces sp. NBC_01212]WSR10812.1 hypothetical protein OG265_34435 [Streptomyces sp. NBC_01208]
MNHRESVDHDAVLRARTLLLGSGTINVHEAVDAYRLLARVNPAVYLPRLSRALLEYGVVGPGDAETRLTVLTEAASAARRMNDDEPKRAALLLKALEACERELLLLGRTGQARAVREESALTGREEGRLG